MLGVGIVGAGMVADVNWRALRDLDDLVSIVGVHNRSSERLKKFCSERSLEPFEDLDDLLGHPDVDVILVLTPPNARREIVRKATEEGKHILLEKPIERDLDAATDLVETAEKAGVTLGVIFQHRFREASEELRRQIQAGRLGKLVCAMVEVPWWRPQSYYDEPGRGTYERDGGGVLINQAIHTLDLMLSYTGPVSEVSALSATTTLHDMEAEDFVSAGIRFASGAVGSVVATTAAYPGGSESITLQFENASLKLQSGTLTTSWQNGEVETFGETATTGGGADPMAFPHDWHSSAQRDFFVAVGAGRQPTVDGAEALKVHRLIDAMTRSSSEGRTIILEDTNLEQG
ncbi:Gfo/Idh/MocA family oxidoreductase [Palleronia sp. LCG004]|uniref:Gfo/Idh/MocA family protein n=1 Tax=Palleronia sp. LCG004 TaxID=3079304 RepID=UPI002943E846|nr:Gfo/Idh/MocA family oxidoreductase [Palleronia sp. LCG004]WOI56980.1 Gfo/Idh/MocA family oxidoreductase [Palleronia sp. LCG004]